MPDDLGIVPRCQPGDIWQLGPHRLICGNSLDEPTIRDLMNGDMARMVFTDPPYNVPIDGHVGGSGKTKHREFAMASGEMTISEFTAFLKSAFQNMAAHEQIIPLYKNCFLRRLVIARRSQDLQPESSATFSQPGLAPHQCPFRIMLRLSTWEQHSGSKGPTVQILVIRVAAICSLTLQLRHFPEWVNNGPARVYRFFQLLWSKRTSAPDFG